MLLQPTHLFGVAQVPLCLPTARGATTVTMRLSSSSPEGMKPPPKKAHFGAFMQVSSQYACGVICCLSGPCFSHRFP
jgi:hypothetical protein